MKKKSLWFTCFVIIQLLLVSSLGTAGYNPRVDNGQYDQPALEKSPAANAEEDVVRINFIHYAKSSNATSPKKNDPGYKLMKVKWLWQEDYVINLASIPDELTSPATVQTIISGSSAAWDDETGRALFGQVTEDNDAHYGNYDDKNTVEFGKYVSPEVIAVTTVWYSMSNKAILEFDMLFNTDYEWSTSGYSVAMDLQNIASHEFGHAVGLNDIYNSYYDYVTMYGYADYGETYKSTLAPPDITGLQKLYGL